MGRFHLDFVPDESEDKDRERWYKENSSCHKNLDKRRKQINKYKVKCENEDK